MGVAGWGFLQEGSFDGRMPRYSVRNHCRNTRPPDDLYRSIHRGCKQSDLPFIEQSLSIEVNERFIISDDYSLLPINVGAPNFATSNNCKQLTIMKTIVFLTSGKDLAEKGNRFM